LKGAGEIQVVMINVARFGFTFSHSGKKIGKIISRGNEYSPDIDTHAWVVPLVYQQDVSQIFSFGLSLSVIFCWNRGIE
jgi:hypothetical protein